MTIKIEFRTQETAQPKQKLSAPHFIFTFFFAMLHYHKDTLHIESCSLIDIAARFGTPCYIYSQKAIIEAAVAYQQAYQQEYSHQSLVCYAVKASSNIHLLSLLAELGCGFDIVSIGELERVLAAGGDPAKVVFSGVGKQIHELERALTIGIKCFNVESNAELDMLQNCAQQLGIRAPVSIRINPDVDAKTHPYIATGLEQSKFGIDLEQAKVVYQRAHNLSMLDVVGIDCHIGSQITSITPFEHMLDSVASFVQLLHKQGVVLQHIDIGGGVGICYDQEKTISLAHLAATVERALGHFGAEVIMEPGRSIVGNAGALLTRCILTKHNYTNRFVIVDAAMNDLLRPALYQGHHTIWHTQAHPARKTERTTIVGPVCESGDFFAQDISLAVDAGDLLAIASAGAYGFAMSSNYNSRPRAAEVLIDRFTARLIRKRESTDSLLQHELQLTE